VIGGGSCQYSPQSIYTGVQEGTHVIFVVLRNQDYAILKDFAVLENTPNVPWLDVSLGKGYGAATALAATPEAIQKAFQKAMDFGGTSVIEIPISGMLKSLLG
jgi:benzoylformate decarboxylase